MTDCAKVWNGRKIILFKEGNIMAITKLNNVLVKHGKIMFGIITAIIIVAFVWFFTPGADGSILFGSNPYLIPKHCILFQYRFLTNLRVKYQAIIDIWFLLNNL